MLGRSCKKWEKNDHVDIVWPIIQWINILDCLNLNSYDLMSAIFKNDDKLLFDWKTASFFIRYKIMNKTVRKIIWKMLRCKINIVLCNWLEYLFLRFRTIKPDD